MIKYQQLLRDAIAAVSILSPTSFSWFHEPSPILPRKLRDTLSPRNAREFLLNELTAVLYSRFYTRGVATPSTPEMDRYPPPGFTPFATELSTANSGTGYWEDGWHVVAVEDGNARVRRGGLLLWADLSACWPTRPGAITPGDAVRLRVAKESLNVSPAFYVAFGNNPLIAQGADRLLRLYWNIDADGAVSFVKDATTRLNDADLPFRLKVLRDPSLFTRCDAAVVYISKGTFRAVASLLCNTYAEVSAHMKPGVPVFTKPLSGGVGVAEDPVARESFGRNRCRLVAEALIRAYELDRNSVDDRLKIVSDRLAEDNISLAEPFLNSGSTDNYIPFVDLRSETIREPQPSKLRGASVATDIFLRTADELGWRLAREAVWLGDQCNWLGALPMARRDGEHRLDISYTAMGPDFYSGTSGIALFLAELYVASGARDVRRTALGAIQQALGYVDSVSANCYLGLYSGALGVVFAAARVGILLGEEHVVRRAAELLARLLMRQRQSEGLEIREYDLLSGDAGTIVALLVLQDVLQDPSFISIARDLGDRLVRGAVQSNRGWSWGSPTHHHRRNLIGLAHGTSGIGHALLELFAATGDTRYRSAAARAHEYERSWFDSSQGNWPDFRERVGRQKFGTRSYDFSTFWCHGAPGIGLARLGAYDITNDTTCKEEACLALNTTCKMLETALGSGSVNYSLCHGLAGNVDVLLHARSILPAYWDSKASLAWEVAEAGIARSSKRGGTWSCGVEKAETPGLLLGLAGIGYFCLRLHDPAVPSVLMLRRKDFSPSIVGGG